MITSQMKGKYLSRMENFFCKNYKSGNVVEKMINKNAKINPSSRIRTSDLWMTTPLQSTALPTELGLGEDRLMEGGKEGKRKK